MITDNKTNTQKARIFLGLLALGLVTSGTATAQSSRDVANRVERLENEVETLSRAVYRGEAPPPGAFGTGGDQANLGVRLDQLETEIRAMNGKVEEQAFMIDQLKSQLERMSGDLEMRFNDLTQGGSPAARYMATPSFSPPATLPADIPPDMAPPPEAGGFPPPPDAAYQWSSTKGADPISSGSMGAGLSVPSDAGAAVYEEAYAQLKNGQYDGAERGFTTFLSQYPSHSLATNAKYWLGESYYARKDYTKASRTFAEAYQAAPKGPKAPDNLLKLGMSLGGMGKKEDACIALGQIEKEFSTGAGPVLQRAQQEMTRLGC